LKRQGLEDKLDSVQQLLDEIRKEIAEEKEVTKAILEAMIGIRQSASVLAQLKKSDDERKAKRAKQLDDARKRVEKRKKKKSSTPLETSSSSGNDPQTDEVCNKEAV
jgi:thioredoxin-like negative regulator of GroEL